jgi:hypothetical protein
LPSFASGHALTYICRHPRGAAAPSTAALSSARNLRSPADVQAKLQRLKEIDLVKGRYDKWPILHDQGDRQTCIAFAVTACLELLRATQSGNFVSLSPQFVYWHMRTGKWPPPLPPGWEDGATKLSHARQVLATYGFCSWQACPSDSSLPPGESLEGPEPSAAATAEGTAHRVPDGVYQPEQVPGIARQVYDQLAQRRPVAIAIPVYSQADGSALTNWSVGMSSGEVVDPYKDKFQVFNSGHAVCVVGFQPDPLEPGGGWFIFRNSIGLNWASGLWYGDDAPRIPGRGYGAISATYVEGYCWEFFSPILT